MQLQWLKSKYEPKIIYIVRNPVDVIFSLLRTNWYHKHMQIGLGSYSKSLSGETLLKEWSAEINFEDPVRCLAWMWFLENVVPLTEMDTSSMLVIPYEYLCSYDQNDFVGMFSKLGTTCDFNEKFIRRPSATTKLSSGKLKNGVYENVQKVVYDCAEASGFNLYLNNDINTSSFIYKKWSMDRLCPLM